MIWTKPPWELDGWGVAWSKSEGFLALVKPGAMPEKEPGEHLSREELQRLVDADAAQVFDRDTIRRLFRALESIALD
jgi:hypothetical protein